MTRMKPHDDRPRGKPPLTTERTKEERITACCTIARGAMEKGNPWPEVKELLEQQMVIRWKLGATARRDYLKQVELLMAFEASKLMMQEKHK